MLISKIVCACIGKDTCTLLDFCSWNTIAFINQTIYCKRYSFELKSSFSLPLSRLNPEQPNFIKLINNKLLSTKQICLPEKKVTRQDVMLLVSFATGLLLPLAQQKLFDSFIEFGPDVTISCKFSSARPSVKWSLETKVYLEIWTCV